MNVLDLPIEELEAAYWAASEAFTAAGIAYNEAADRLNERKRLDALKAKLGDVSAADLEMIKNAMALGVGSISSEETAIQ
jgi:hypothetical protein